MRIQVPLPVPTDTNLRQWARNLVAYLKSLEREVEIPGPKVVQLEHRKPGAKATEDGLLMWCPMCETPIVAFGGHWYELPLGPVADI